MYDLLRVSNKHRSSMTRRTARAGLFNGTWTDLDGHKIRRVRRDEYGELYRLHRRHAAIRLGCKPVGMRAPWTLAERVDTGAEGFSPPAAHQALSANVYGFGNLHPDTA